MDPEHPKYLNCRRVDAFILETLQQKQRDEIISGALGKGVTKQPQAVHYDDTIELCNALKEVTRERYIENRRRQQIRDSNEELKQLEAQFRVAYARKILESQIFERNALKNEDLYRKQQETIKLQEARLKLQETVQKEEAEKRAKMNAYKTILNEQMQELNKKRFEQYREMMDEREDFDAQSQKSEEARRKALDDEVAKKAKVKKEYDELLRIKKEKLAMQTLIDKAEYEKREAFVKQKSLKQQQIEEEKRKQKLRQEQLKQEMGRQIYEKEQRVIKQREHLEALLIDEKNTKDEMYDREELERRHRDCIAQRLQMEKDLRAKEQKLLKQKEMEREEFAAQMQYLAERDKLEQLSDEKRRQKILKHRRELQDAYNRQKEVKAEKMKKEILEHREHIQKAQEMEEIIDSERIRMIKEHCPALVKYLPQEITNEMKT